MSESNFFLSASWVLIKAIAWQVWSSASLKWTICCLFCSIEIFFAFLVPAVRRLHSFKAEVSSLRRQSISRRYFWLVDLVWFNLRRSWFTAAFWVSSAIFCFLAVKWVGLMLLIRFSFSASSVLTCLIYSSIIRRWRFSCSSLTVKVSTSLWSLICSVSWIPPFMRLPVLFILERVTEDIF